MVGKEDSVLMPTGTMANQISLLSNCDSGDLVIVG
jgi:threonine aldolase